VLVIAAHDGTSVRTRTGALLGRFRSPLPGGGRGGGGGGGGGRGGEFTILDAVLAEAPQLTATSSGRGSGGGSGGGGGGGSEQAAAHTADCEMGEQHHQAGGAAHAPSHASGGGGGGRGGLPPGCVLFVADVMAWNGVDLAGCSAECRAFWLAGRAAEGGIFEPPPPGACAGAAAAAAAGPGDVPAGGGGSGESGGVAACGGGGPRLALLPALPATPDGLLAAARGASAGPALGFVQDGALLLHREGRYCPGQTPLALLWKDAGCSRYMLVPGGGGGGVRGAARPALGPWGGDGAPSLTPGPGLTRR
jgi:hypothetical protein